MEDYNVNQNESGIRKHESVMSNCDMSTGDDQISHCDPSYPRNDDILLANSLVDNEVTAYLASSGMAGLAAATAIASASTRNKSYTFETIPAVRKRQSTRLLRKLQVLVEEYCVRVGQQAIVLVCNPRVAQRNNHHVDNSNASTFFKVFGSNPLQDVIRNLRPLLIQELDTALHSIQLQHEQSGGNSASVWGSRDNETLPPLMVEGIPTPLDKMTQAQLRAFIPVMLKYATNRGKPGWGRPQARPPWWPEEVPWANVRSDVRTAEEKSQVSWTVALKKVVRNCYEYHGREDLISEYVTDQSQMNQMSTSHLLDMENAAAAHSSQFIIGHPPINDVNDSSHNNMYTLMHMPTSEGLPSQSTYEPYTPATSYSFKTLKDGTISIVRIDDGSKSGDPQTLDNTTVLEDYNVENVKFQTGDEISMNNFTNGGDMVSIPADTMMQLDNDATATLYQIISNSRHKASMNHNSHDPGHVSDNL